MKMFYKLVSRWHSEFGSELCIFSFTLTRYDCDTVKRAINVQSHTSIHGGLIDLNIF